jgi:nucleoside phosphorylase
MSDYVIIVPKHDELMAAEWGFETNLREPDERTRSGVDLFRRDHPTGTVTFALLDKQTNTYSSVLTADVIARETPHLVFLLGTAMGRAPQTSIGSILVSDGVIDLSEKRITDEGPGAYVQHPLRKSDELTLDAREYIARSFGQDQINRHLRSMTKKPAALVKGATRIRDFITRYSPKAMCEPIVSGNEYRLATNVNHADDLWAVAPTARGYDMEAAGFALAAANSGTQWLVVRGISDYGTPDTKSDFHRSVAAGAAARFVYEFLKYGLVRARALPTATEPAITISRLRDEAFRLDGVWTGAMSYLDDNLNPVVFEERVELTPDGANVRGVVKSRHIQGESRHNALEYSIAFSIARNGYAGGVWSETVAARRYFGVMLGQLEDDSTTLSGTWLGTYHGGVRRGFFRWHNIQRDGEENARRVDVDSIVTHLIASFTDDRGRSYNDACGVMA